MFLLDVNVLIALCDECHEFRSAAKSWFVKNRASGWATCPLTENGMVRVMGSPAYGSGKTTTDVARELLQVLTEDPSHVFVPDDISICKNSHFHDLETATSKTLTDLYLIKLANYHNMLLSTFDARMARQNKFLSSELIIIPTGP